MSIPTRAEWDKTKSDAGISKTPWYKPADAAVGPAISAVDAARTKWKAKKDYPSAGSYVIALGKLHAAFGKFLDKKQVSATGPLGVKIAGWINDVATKYNGIQGKLPALESKWNENGVKIIDSL